VRVRVGKKVHDEVAKATARLNALDSALRAALAKSFPKLKKIRSPITSAHPRRVAGTAAKTRVLIESSDGKREWAPSA